VTKLYAIHITKFGGENYEICVEMRRDVIGIQRQISGSVRLNIGIERKGNAASEKGVDQNSQLSG
jgi:hypothetical protein